MTTQLPKGGKAKLEPKDLRGTISVEELLAQARLEERQQVMKDIKALIITHFHGDDNHEICEEILDVLDLLDNKEEKI